MKNTSRFLALLIALTFLFSASVVAETAIEKTDVVKSLFEITFSVIDCDYDIYGNSSGYVIRFSSEKYSEMYIMAQLFGNEDTDAVMHEASQGTADFCYELRENVGKLGVDKPNLTLILTDYREKDYIFLIVCNGQIVYDIIAD